MKKNSPLDTLSVAEKTIHIKTFFDSNDIENRLYFKNKNEIRFV